MTRILRTTGFALALGSLVLVGCSSSGGGDSADSTTTTAAVTTTTDASAAFSADLDALCTAGDAAATQASNDFSTALDALTAANNSGDQAAYTTALDDAETATEAIIAAIDDFQAAINGLDVPADLQQPLDAYVSALAEQKTLAQNLRTALVADDGAAFTAATDAISAADADSTQIRTDAANQLNAPACVPDATNGGGSATTDTTASTDTTAAG